MADIRIKDLTTTASSTASDDFIAVDGTTNGTRKLNAFSPTFGGNATVTGTLTVNGTGTYGAINLVEGTTLGKGLAFGTDITIYRNFANQLSTTAYALTGGVSGAGYFSIVASGSSVLTFNNGSGESFRVGASRGVNIGDTADVAAGNLKVSGTTASTTTSTGALVVGNGTSGGLGVGGAIVAGGTITSTASTDSGLLQLNLVNSSTGTSASSLFRFNAGTRTATLQAYNDTHATLAGQLRIATSNGDIAVIPSGVTAATFGASAISLGAINYANTITGGDTGSGTNILLLKDGLGTLKVNFKGNGDVALLSSSISTSTSSGALVVSGGVGVAGAMNVGGSMKLNYFSTAGDPTALGVVQLYATTNTTSGAGGIEWKADTGGNGYGYRTLTVFDGVSAYDLYTQVRTNSASWTNSLILKSNGNATFSGSVQTSAPTGGTSAAWKLGTVATVSPTSPNRTIEVDIGGTIYYIAAKTTNN